MWMWRAADLIGRRRRLVSPSSLKSVLESVDSSSVSVFHRSCKRDFVHTVSSQNSASHRLVISQWPGPVLPHRILPSDCICPIYSLQTALWGREAVYIFPVLYRNKHTNTQVHELQPWCRTRRQPQKFAWTPFPARGHSPESRPFESPSAESSLPFLFPPPRGPAE